MKTLFSRLSAYSLAILSSGCATRGFSPPLVFGQTTNVGVTINGSPTDQSAEFTLGYRDKNFAVVPVASPTEAGVTPIRSIVPSRDGEHQDALSVLGQFEVDAGSNAQGPHVGLGKFFATGSAAKKLADGFACKLSEGTETICTHAKAAAPTAPTATPADGEPAAPQPTK